MSNPINTPLIDRLVANDPAAWTELVLIYSPILRRRLSSRGVPVQELDDLTQEILVAAWKGRDTLKLANRSASFLAWVWVIANRCAGDWFRQQGLRPLVVGGSDHQLGLENLPNEAIPPPSEEEKAELLNEVVRNLDVTDRDRQVLILCCIEGCSASDAGRSLDMTDVAVRRSKSRLLQMIRTRLQGLENLEF